MTLNRRTAVCLATTLSLLVAAAGCRDSDNDQPDSTVLADGGADGAASTVQVLLSVNDCTTSLSVEGTTVCALENGVKSSNCATTDKDGEATIVLPAATNSGLFVQHAGVSVQRFLPLRLTENTTLGQCYETEAELTQQFGVMGTPYPPASGTGAVWLEGDTGALIQALGQGEKGPFYLNTSGEPDTTTQNMIAPVPAGWLMEVPVGEHEVKISKSGGLCTLRTVGWPPAAGDASVHVPVFEGTITESYVNCP